jgi:hypothetical protein
MNKYASEVKEKYGNTTAYQEYTEKTKNYSSDKWNDLTKGMNDILQEFTFKKEEGFLSDSIEVQNLVKKLQNFITENYYLCTKEILASLGKMYVEDIRFKNNIDKFGEGTAVFISSAIKVFCQ